MSFFTEKHGGKFRRIISILLAGALALGLMAVLPGRNVSAQTAVIATQTDPLSVHKTPDLDTSSRSGTIPKGATVTVLEKDVPLAGSAYTLAKVEYIDSAGKNLTGYVSSQYLTFNPDTTEAPATDNASGNPATTTVSTASADATTSAPASTLADPVLKKNKHLKNMWRYGKTTAKYTIYKSRSRNSKKVKKIKKKTLILVKSYKYKNGENWYKVIAFKGNKTWSGYIPSLSFKYQSITAYSGKYKLYKASKKITVYQYANATGKKLGKVAKGKEVILLASFKVGPTTWAKVKSSKGTGYTPEYNLTFLKSTVSSTIRKDGKMKKKATARKLASTMAKSKGRLKKGKKVTVLGFLDVNGTTWYKVKFKLKKKNKTGYVKASQVSGVSLQTMTDFPESYRPYLQALSALHPNWVFVPKDTGLSWSQAVAGENVSGKNTIQKTGTVSDAWLSQAAGDYNASTGKYVVKDGTNWYTASRQVIEHYMDPRNYLTEQGIFQFESLAFESTQTKDIISGMLANSFMSGNYDVTDIATGTEAAGSYADAFMDAATRSGVSPTYLVTRVFNEVGRTGGTATSGYTAGHVGYYNFYNIGAFDGGNAAIKGLEWAAKTPAGDPYLRPWTTPYKSIVGGAIYIGTDYIAKGQNTMYTQKFNVVIPGSLFQHQYMTAVNAAAVYALNIYAGYTNSGTLGNAYTFTIPVYSEMPETPASLP